MQLLAEAFARPTRLFDWPDNSEICCFFRTSVFWDPVECSMGKVARNDRLTCLFACRLVRFETALQGI